VFLPLAPGIDPLLKVGRTNTSNDKRTTAIAVLAAKPIDAPNRSMKAPITNAPTCARHIDRDINPDVLPRISSVEASITILG
jgi:hypothetical protein